jgi:MtfA peptidase
MVEQARRSSRLRSAVEWSAIIGVGAVTAAILFLAANALLLTAEIYQGRGFSLSRGPWGYGLSAERLATLVLGILVTVGGALGSWLYDRHLERSVPARKRPRRPRHVGPSLHAAPTPRQAPAEARLPAAWQRFLRRRCDHYVRLPVELRGEFDHQVHVFLSTRRITGVEVEVTAPMRLLVAASAAMLTVGWPGFEWTRLSEVLLYPRDFDEEYRFDSAERAGQAHEWGIVLLSVPSLRKSFADPADGYHAGVHEFMHLLDVEGGEFDGIPSGFTLAHTAAWDRIRCREEKRLWQGRSVLDPYGLTNRVEFLAVTAEAFFETPVRLHERHRQLYDMLAAYFRQDPAAWESARRRKPR